MRFLIAALVFLAFTVSVGGQAPPPMAESPAVDQVLFLKTARQALQWDEPAKPQHIVGPIYFVGTQGLAAYLIATPQGHVLINTGMPGSGPLIADSIRQLGFKPEDIRILLLGHAHCDHVGDLAYLQRVSGARVAVMTQEVALLESGGKEDFLYAAYPEFAFAPVQTTQPLRDGDTIELGGVVLTALLTPGHTKGSTTYITRVVDGGQTYTVVFPNGTSVNPGYRLVRDPSYPGIADDYRRTLHVLGGLRARCPHRRLRVRREARPCRH
jgi:metallo-beta-lactamase class B